MRLMKCVIDTAGILLLQTLQEFLVLCAFVPSQILKVFRNHGDRLIVARSYHNPG